MVTRGESTLGGFSLSAISSMDNFVFEAPGRTLSNRPIDIDAKPRHVEFAPLQNPPIHLNAGIAPHRPLFKGGKPW